MTEHSATLSTHHAGAHGHDDDHLAKAPRQYLLTLIALLMLTAITVGVSYIDFGSGNIVVAVMVATMKAILVGLIFMHLLHDKKINATIFVAAFLFLSLLFLFTLLDEGSRQTLNVSRPPAGGIPQDAMKTATAIEGKPAVLSLQAKPTPAASSAPVFVNPPAAQPAPAAAAPAAATKQ